MRKTPVQNEWVIFLNDYFFLLLFTIKILTNMNKNLLLVCLSVLSSLFLSAQAPQQVQNSCGTPVPPQQWEEWLSSKVEEFKKNNLSGKTAAIHDIPVIVHIVAYNEALGTYPNLDTNQIKSNIASLNADFAGIGFNVGNTPPYFAGDVANTGIRFCMAAKDRQDLPLVPHGIDRVSAFQNNWLSPSTMTVDLQTYFNTVIIPATIWDPTKYLNIWISDKPTNYPLNGWATYPPNSGLTGVFNGTVGTANNDGIWIWAKQFGVGTGVVAPYDKGRTLTHEAGHWLGLRHIWGDGNCLSDYCQDTPPAKAAHYGCQTVTPADQCGVGTSPNGQMPMNFMDRTDDACMYMFTNDQSIRMNTALSQSSLRYQLGTHSKCSQTGAPSTSAVASFTVPADQCLNSPFTPFNTSTGWPIPTYVWSSSPSGAFYPNNTVANPAVTLSNPGTYTLTLVSTNSVSSSTATFVVSAQFTCATKSFCFDTLLMIKNIDTLVAYRSPTSAVTGCSSNNSTGFLAGTNCYQDKEFAQYFPASSYVSFANPQVNSVIVLFDSAGTKGNAGTQIACRIYGGSVGSGPTSSQAVKFDSLGRIMSTPTVKSVGYIGKSGVKPITNNKMIPYKFDFTQPVIITSPNAGFFTSISIPQTGSDSVNIMTNTKFNSSNDSSAWYLSSTTNWKTMRTNRKAKVQLAILPIVTCGPVGINELAMNKFNSNITIMPNPSNGVFNFMFTLPQEQTLTINVYNSTGQRIISSELKNVMNNSINLDLSDRPDGIYFTEITNGKDKAVKKIIVAR
ncbi:hypothetical protein CNR22_21220 [Sphingobacteriaceae bacterium]|nr:hypothetical protein CNR22_21220 [Sphingobacteriaceae bacterium]